MFFSHFISFNLIRIALKYKSVLGEFICFSSCNFQNMNIKYNFNNLVFFSIFPITFRNFGINVTCLSLDQSMYLLYFLSYCETILIFLAVGLVYMEILFNSLHPQYNCMQILTFFLIPALVILVSFPWLCWNNLIDSRWSCFCPACHVSNLKLRWLSRPFKCSPWPDSSVQWANSMMPRGLGAFSLKQD